MTLRALIIDDELHCRENLQLLIEDYCPEVQIIGSASDALSAKNMIESELPDLVFLDIMMPGKDGFGLLGELESRDFTLVFTTAHSEFALRAFKSGAVDYLQKPIDIEELRAAVDKASERQRSRHADGSLANTVRKVLEDLGMQNNQGELAVPTRDGLEILRYEEIVRLEGSDSYTTLFLADGRRFVSSRTIKVYEDNLPSSQFCRVHKAHLINIRQLRTYSRSEGHIAVMRNGDQIPISRRKLALLLARIQTF